MSKEFERIINQLIEITDELYKKDPQLLDYNYHSKKELSEWASNDDYNNELEIHFQNYFDQLIEKNNYLQKIDKKLYERLEYSMREYFFSTISINII